MAKPKLRSRLRICKRCEKREITYSRSDFCRHCYHYEFAKKRRKDRVKNKCCAQCGKKVKPKIIIPYRCEECQSRIQESKLNKKEAI